ncbi:hypothetical protein Y1Q_0001827 [Alligator mississippiensis]|uniref:Uncharacterized protein n=1 Tax=Alligator mississippiensis TaxID=8496 RepID=A0A151ML04_ALLMI|nr:hypothetical protein Y1Q_0001827 [Alligator mississippiensis]
MDLMSTGVRLSDMVVSVASSIWLHRSALSSLFSWACCQGSLKWTQWPLESDSPTWLSLLPQQSGFIGLSLPDLGLSLLPTPL